MSILINKSTGIMIQGMTGKQGRIHGQLMIEYGANVQCGISPGKGGMTVLDRPIYNSVAEAMQVHDISASLVLVPPLAVKSSVTEALQNGIKVITVIADGVPVKDTMYIREMAHEYGAVISGPNTTGIISPGKSKLGIMPGALYSEGNIGIVSRSGSLTHEVASALSLHGIGQSTCFGIGGDPIPCTTYTEILELFRNDPETESVVLIGEIGGNNEDNAAEYLLRSNYPKQVYSFIVGRSAPPGKNMGHAGAIISGGTGSAESKREKLRKGGVTVVDTIEELIEVIRKDAANQ